MSRLLSGGLAVLLVVALTLPLHAPTAGTAGDAGSMSIWEAYSRGVLSIQQVDMEYEVGGVKDIAPLGYRITNTGTAKVLVDENAMLLSPSPGSSGGLTTQDGVLTVGSVPASGELTYGWGDFVAQGLLPDPPWWCSEEYQSVRAGVSVGLGGEILPFAAQPIVAVGTPLNGGTQDSLWDFLRSQPTLIVGKTVDGGFWGEIPETEGQSLQVVLRATNLAILDSPGQDPSAPKARVWDVIPPGFTLDSKSLSPGFIKSTLPDGSTKLEWKADLPAADVPGSPSEDEPTAYHSMTFTYRMITPSLTPGRLSLPRAQISVTNDGTSDAHSAQPVLDVFAQNEPPVADAGGSYQGTEGSSITFSAAASSDPDGDALTYRWDFQADGVWDTTWSSAPTAVHTYGDDYAGSVWVQVNDGEYSALADATVTVGNVAPSVSAQVQASLTGTLTLRVAGEKFHDVVLTLYQGGAEAATASVVRMPGNPDEQVATLEGVDLDLLSGSWSAVATYTPLDDPVNGQVWGATPAWLIFTLPSGEEARLQHTFNARHEGTWTWEVSDLGALLVDVPLSVQATATATDPGSDDLTFIWSWGDGTGDAITTHYNDGSGPDGYPSASVNPMTAADSASHTYAAMGAYTITLTVVDDDGGVTTMSWTVGA